MKRVWYGLAIITAFGLGYFLHFPKVVIRKVELPAIIKVEKEIVYETPSGITLQSICKDVFGREQQEWREAYEEGYKTSAKNR